MSPSFWRKNKCAISSLKCNKFDTLVCYDNFNKKIKQIVKNDIKSDVPRFWFHFFPPPGGAHKSSVKYIAVKHFNNIYVICLLISRIIVEYFGYLTQIDQLFSLLCFYFKKCPHITSVIK